MPRQRGPARSAPRPAAPAPARPAPARPTAPQRPAGYTSANTQQRRPSSTAATAAPHNNPTPTPPAAASAPAANAGAGAGATQQSAGPGLFGQMASTAAGVAVGSSIGHAVGNWFTGGSSSSAPLDSASPQAQPPADAQPMDAGLYQSSSNTWAAEHGAPCENDIKAFRKCMDEQDGNMSICGWYLDQLKACQAAAKPY